MLVLVRWTVELKLSDSFTDRKSNPHAPVQLWVAVVSASKW